MVLNLDPEITEDELKDLFQSVGPVRSAVITTNVAGTQVGHAVCVLNLHLLLVTPLIPCL